MPAERSAGGSPPDPTLVQLTPFREGMDLELTRPQSGAEQSHASRRSAAAAQIGRYRLRQKIGAGGMGEVWLADQTEPIRRTVALKLIRAGILSDQSLARFEAERQALALMDHPNIARILDAGVSAAGQPFFVMEHVNGRPITQFCDRCRMPLRDRLILFVQVCQAIQHAHAKGVVHRDLKPNNILVGQFDDRPVAKVIDFGLAKAMGIWLTDRSLATGVGSIVGTPAYMSPEQATLEAREITARSDVYSLGVVLYELATGAPPFEADRLSRTPIDDVFRIVREEAPRKASEKFAASSEAAGIAALRRTAPRSMEKAMARSLDGILARCLEKDSAQRYADVGELIAAIRQCYRSDFGAAGWWSWPRRAAAVVGVVAVLGVLVWALNRPAPPQAVTAHAAPADESRIRYNRDVGLLADAYKQKDHEKIDSLLRGCPEGASSGIEWHIFNRFRKKSPLNIITRTTSLKYYRTPLSSRLTPDSFLLTRSRSDDKHSMVIDLLGEADFHYSPDGRLIVILEHPATVHVLNAADGSVRESISLPPSVERPSGAIVSDNGKHCIVFTEVKKAISASSVASSPASVPHSTAYIRSANQDYQKYEFQETISSACISNNGRLAFFGLKNGRLIAVDCVRMETKTYSAHQDALSCMALNDDGTLVTLGNAVKDKPIKELVFWDVFLPVPLQRCRLQLLPFDGTRNFDYLVHTGTRPEHLFFQDENRSLRLISYKINPKPGKKDFLENDPGPWVTVIPP